MQSKTLGSIFILCGTTIGAGLLALPLTAAGLGFVPTVVLLIISYFITALSSLVILEALVATTAKVDGHFDSICRATLGKSGEALFLVSYITLMYSITAAYLSGGSSIFQLLLMKLGTPLSDWICSVMFTLILGFIVYQGARTTDFVNRYIMLTKGLLFLCIIWFFLPAIKVSYLLDMKDNSPFIFGVIPIIFLIFGYQLILPTLYIYLEKDVTEMKKAIFIGSFISLLVFFLWLLTTLASIPRFGDNSFHDFLSSTGGDNVANFFDFIGQVQSHDITKSLMNIFSNLALITSFLGITLSLKDYIFDLKPIKKTSNPQITATLLTFSIPVLLVIFKPQIFQTALNYAAGMLVIVLLWLPCAMSFRIRKRAKQQNATLTYQAPGGMFSLYLLLIVGILIFALSLLATFGWLPTFGAYPQS
jgi:tyrosine-specific transport protein